VAGMVVQFRTTARPRKAGEVGARG
jgi:hypothetical protein